MKLRPHCTESLSPPLLTYYSGMLAKMNRPISSHVQAFLSLLHCKQYVSVCLHPVCQSTPALAATCARLDSIYTFIE